VYLGGGGGGGGGVVHVCFVHKQIKIINDSSVARVECLGGGVSIEW
jgi:hypothetical protein